MKVPITYTVGGAAVVGKVTPGLESLDMTNIMSTEDYAVANAELADLSATQEADILQVDRLEDQAAGMTAFADVAEHVEVADGPVLALADVGADLATIGTDASTESNMVPGLESYMGKRLSLEGFRETAKKFYETIMKILEAIWERSKALWKHVTDMLPRIVSKANDVELKAKDKASNAPASGTTIALARQAKLLAVEGVAPKNGAWLVANLSKLHQAAGRTLSDITEKVAVGGVVIASKIEAYTIPQSEATLSAVNARYTKMLNEIETKFPNADFTDNRFPQGSTVKAIAGLMGGKSLFFVRPAETAQAADVMASAVANRQAQLVMMDYTAEPELPGADLTIPAFPSSDAAKIADTIKDIVAVFARYRVKEHKTLEAAAAEMQKVTKASISVGGKENDDKVVRKQWEAIAAYNTAFAKMANSGIGQFVQQTMNACMAALVVADRNLDAI